MKPLLKVNHAWYQKEHIPDADEMIDSMDESASPRENFDVLQQFFAINDKQDEELRGKDSEYVNLDMELSSAAIVEILWSKFDAICVQRREGMSPVMIEGLLYLKENRHLWNADTVAKALDIIKKREMTERVNKKAAMLKEQEEMIVSAAAAITLNGDAVVDMTADAE